MKKYHIHTKASDILHRFPALGKRLTSLAVTLAQAGAPRVLGFGADLEKAGACVAVQPGLTEPVQLGTLSRAELLLLVQALVAQGWRCVVGVEACGFGWAFPRELRAAGAEVLSFATEALTGRRKTNKRDAAALARLVVDRTLHGNQKAGRIVREPSPAEQQRRYLSRHRAQLVALRGKIEGHGRGLLYDFGQLAFPECWWGKKMWPRLAAQLTAAGETWLCAALAAQRTMAVALHAQILELDQCLAALAAQTLTLPLPHGLGQLTALTACLEVMDWQRFSNRKKAGSFIGCCPSEHSTARARRWAASIGKEPAPAQPADGGRLAAAALGARLARLRQMGTGHPRPARQQRAQKESRHRLRAPALYRPVAALHPARHFSRPRLPRLARRPPRHARPSGAGSHGCLKLLGT